MNKYAIELPLNEVQNIIVDLKDPLNFICWDYSEPVLFSDNNSVITLASNSTYFNVRDLRGFLKKALNNELQLHESITSDIGYLLNGYYKNGKMFAIKQLDNGYQEWVGYEYYLWQAFENKKKYVTWMYNDHDQNIIFEITPFYPFFYDKRKEQHYVPFKKWILSYKPYFITKLSRVTAQQWLDQADEIVKTIDDNVVRWKEEYKNLK